MAPGEPEGNAPRHGFRRKVQITRFRKKVFVRGRVREETEMRAIHDPRFGILKAAGYKLPSLLPRQNIRHREQSHATRSQDLGEGMQYLRGMPEVL